MKDKKNKYSLEKIKPPKVTNLNDIWALSALVRPSNPEVGNGLYFDISQLSIV